jgi:hypothetical protein
MDLLASDARNCHIYITAGHRLNVIGDPGLRMDFMCRAPKRNAHHFLALIRSVLHALICINAPIRSEAPSPAIGSRKA